MQRQCDGCLIGPLIVYMAAYTMQPIEEDEEEEEEEVVVDAIDTPAGAMGGVSTIDEVVYPLFYL